MTGPIKILFWAVAINLLSVLRREMVLRFPTALVGRVESEFSTPLGEKTTFWSLKPSGGGGRKQVC